MAYTYYFKVRWGDTDAAGIVFNPNFYKWMNEASHEYFNAIGLKSSKLFEEEKIGIPLLESTCQFKRPLLFEDEVTIHTSVVELQNKVFKLNHLFTRGEEVIAEGQEMRSWTLFTGKPKAYPIPEDVRRKMQPQIETVEG